MIILLWIYTLVHSYILLVQMLTLNSVLKSSPDTFFLFLLSNNFTEIKIYVFKKTDAYKLYDIGTRDTNERVQQYIYLSYIMFSNYLDDWTLKTIFLFWITEFCVDWIKNFFFDNDNNHDPSVYQSHWFLLWRIFTDCRQKRLNREGPEDLMIEEDSDEDILEDLHIDISKYHGCPETKEAFMKQCNKTKDILCKNSAVDLMLFRKILNEFYHSSIFQNFMILPQTCLILRLIESVIREHGFNFQEIIIIICFVLTIGLIWEGILSKCIRSIAKRASRTA